VINSSLQINYGSGSVVGIVSQDTVTFGGFTVPQQTFLAVTETNLSLLTFGISGIMGLGFEAISGLNATPFWAELNDTNQLSAPIMSIYLQRYIASAQYSESGGTLTLGGTDTSLYTGDIDYNDMPSGAVPSYWLQEVKNLTVHGSEIIVNSTNGVAAIDTGTTLIGAPTNYVEEIWGAVPGSEALTGEYQGMYAYPCSTDLSISVSFGGISWQISNADMSIADFTTTEDSGSMCVGAIFDLGSLAEPNTSLAPTWIFGDTFLKNVYSVFRADPPSVGFAQLSSTGHASGGVRMNTNVAISFAILVVWIFNLVVVI